MIGSTRLIYSLLSSRKVHLYQKKKSHNANVCYQVYSCLCFVRIKQVNVHKTLQTQCNTLWYSIWEMPAIILAAISFYGSMSINFQVFPSVVDWSHLFLIYSFSMKLTSMNYQILPEASKSTSWRNKIQVSSLEGFMIRFSSTNA